MSPYNLDRYRRHSIRLRTHDYSQAGAYFVTICTRDRQPFFEDSHLATIVEDAWKDLPTRFPTIGLDAFVVMPNHIHGVVWLRPSPEGNPASTPKNTSPLLKRPQWNRDTPALGEVVRTFKALSTQRIRQQSLHTGFAWQRNYYEHIIRTKEILLAIRQYIADNPTRWHLDRDNPQAVGNDPHGQTLAHLIQVESLPEHTPITDTDAQKAP